MAQKHNDGSTTSAEAVLIYAITTTLRQKLMRYKEVKAIFNDSPLVYKLLTKMLEDEVIGADYLEEGSIKDDSLLFLRNQNED